MAEHEYNMPKAIQNRLHEIYNAEKHGECAEQAVIDAASELGYEVEDEKESQRDREDGGYMWDVKFVKREPGKYGDVCHVGWAHFNNPGPEYAHRRDEWYMYFL
jgi:hypothetical protein